MEASGLDGIVDCMSKWMSRKYFPHTDVSKVIETPIVKEKNVMSVKLRPIESLVELNNEIIGKDNEFKHWSTLSSPSKSYVSCPSPRSPASSYGSLERLSPPPSPQRPLTPPSSSSPPNWPDMPPSPRLEISSNSPEKPSEIQFLEKKPMELNLNAQGSLAQHYYSTQDKPLQGVEVPTCSNTTPKAGCSKFLDIEKDDYSDYVAVSGPLFPVEAPVKSNFSSVVETVTIQDDENNGPEPELVALSDDDDDEILEIFDQRNIFTQFRPVNNPEFISEDPKENEDINDPEWEKVKNLKDDAERKQFAIESFGNIQPGDPTKNMTYYGFFRQQLRREQDLPPEEIDALKDDLIGEGGRIRDGMLEDVANNDDSTMDISDTSFASSFGDELEETQYLMEGGSRKRKAPFEHQEAPQAKRQMVAVGVYKTKLDHLAVRFKKENVRRVDMKFYMRHWRMGVEETMDFLHYYREDPNNNLVNMEELKKTECIEQIMNQFTTYYGVRERELCKDCSYQEGRDIWHSM